MAGDPEGYLYGQIRPPLSDYIKHILESYPDGQIFKEMIQNADDAGAKKVQFFVDHRTHDSSNVLLSALANYQGPALLSTNDAVFTDQDWKGIQNLQRSGKAGDPFKVGRFGIGFNSVYHLTDVPAIISSDRIAYLDPQEKLWPGQSGRYFKLSDDRTRQCLSSFHGIADFNMTSNYFQQTLFRFPLRNAKSDLSENIYTVNKVLELIDALKKEAKLLLVFLRSVTCIEVFEINDDGHQTLLFQTKITDDFLNEFTRKRLELVTDIKHAHQQNGYQISSIHSLIAQFDVSVYNQGSGSETVHWLVANQVGSTDTTVLTASVKQKVFPWVGAALELDNASNGRVFCFLPMPIEMSSNLPVHINGTFGLTENRRSLMWPSVERRNDATADWNTHLVTKVLPLCYASLLLEARKYLSRNAYYKVWPDVDKLQVTHWEGVLKAFFATLFQNAVICCDNQDKYEWLSHTDVVYSPQDGLTDVVTKVLISCNVKLANITSCVRRAFKFHGINNVTKVNPSYVRSTLQRNQSCLRHLNFQEKIELLKYCWSDGNYSEFDQIELLPLANGNFVCFQKNQHNVLKLYLCSTDYPRNLLPNLDHKLVDISDVEVQTGLHYIANTGQTQLTNLDVNQMAQLIDECMPANWRNANAVQYPWHENFPSDWFDKFWKWVSNKQLSVFENKLIVPTLVAGQSDPSQFTVVRLQKGGTTLYFPLYSTVSPETLSSLQKFGICCSLQASFPFLSHSQLNTYIESFNGRSCLNCLSRCTNLGNSTLSSAEANSLLNLLSTIVNSSDLDTLSQIKIFTSAENTSGKLFSIDEITRQSLLKRVAIEPPNLNELVKVLPEFIILLSASNNEQTQLFSRLGITQQTDSVFIQNYIIPKISSGAVGDIYTDNIMQCVLDNYDMLLKQSDNITDSIKNLRFVKDTADVRKCPHELYNPNSTELAELYQGEPVFPASIYSDYVHVLLQCGLKNSVTTQEILNIIFSISTRGSHLPQPVSTKNIARAQAILNYIQTYQFKQQSGGSYAVDRSVACGYYPFDKALLLLTQSRNWLPVCSQPPPNYPNSLKWKGTDYTDHFMSLQSNTACVTCSSNESLPYIYGSQVFFSNPPVNSDVYEWLGSPKPIMHLCPHFFEVISIKDQIQSDVLLDIVCKVYSAMMAILRSGKKDLLNSLNSVKEWIYIQKYKKFLSVNTVAHKENPNFQHTVDPYLHILPDSISKYSSLFARFGMNQSITRSQIISILKIIRDQISHNTCSSDSGQVWNMVMAVLNWLTNNGTEKFSDESILVPAESSSEYPDLQMSDTLVYTDNDFLRTFISTSETDTDLHFVHTRISPSLSKCLSVTPLSEEMDVSEDTFSDAGQYEPLTVRLKSILKDYKDGVTIIKELIQNADDAEATEINICYDARNHDTDHRRLFFPGMRDSHGPALIVHNNKTFSGDDFENIQKLAAATKANKHLKIGKFGIGFCSVYHITDVPSFISRDRMYIFDPTLKHIGKEAQPGKKVMFLKNVIQRSLQLAPFENMYNFDKSASYEGTIFRLPFRVSPSELSSTCYTRHHFNELLKGIKESGEKLLLFLQHIQKITVQIIDTSDTQPNIVYQISKTGTGDINIDRKYFTKAVEITRTDDDSAGKSTWLIASASLKYSNKDAVASVACELSPNLDCETKYTVDPNFKGEMFCYLPLSLDTGLPVHVSCNFAVLNSRTGIWTKAESTTKSDQEVEWNVFLMNEVIPMAYLNLLLSLRDMYEDSKLQGYKFYHLWPLLEKIQIKNPWEAFVEAFYSSLCSEELFYSETIVCWMNRSSCKLLLDNILCSSGYLNSVVSVLDQLDLPIIQLPNQYIRHVPVTHADIDETNFVKEFFENVEYILEEDISESCNDVLKRMLETYADEYKSNSETVLVLSQHFQTCACIPCRPEGSVFRKCSELVYPNSSFAALFDGSDNRFPIPLLVNNPMTVEGLKKGGMLHQSLPWNLVIERAQSIFALYEEDKEKALIRVSRLLNIISDHSEDCESSLKPELHTIAFLPVLRKPDNYPLEWAGDDSTDLSCGQEMTLSDNSYSSILNPLIAGSQIRFVNESLPPNGGCGRINEDAKEYLHLQMIPTMQNVVHHLQLLSEKAGEIDDKDWITKSCTMIYEFLNDYSEDTDNKDVILQMKTFPSLWNEIEFINTTDVAKNWSQHFGPFLYAVPEIIVCRHQLLSKLSIKEEFSLEDVIKTLNQMKIKFQDGPVDNKSEELLTHILTVFSKSLSNSDCKHLVESSTIYLPDEELTLHKSQELAYHDAGWAPKDSEYNYVHKNITRDIAVQLGVRLVRSKLLDPFLSEKKVYFPGIDFGQRERLTRRLQNILRDYPYDITILKELLQNADDAKATKLYFILDKRTHGTESLISENWQKLQGPALLIWNDSVFTEKDLQGIQELGLGSKRSEAETIGQYGIGFNVVYHLTDCPSFVTGGETLCIMDPHCDYADGATHLCPGRRYDKLSDKGFWNQFSDMSASYLISGLDNLPEVQCRGSLFRFPLRHSEELVKASKILDHENDVLLPMTAENLENDLNNWMPDMNSAMFFLNNVKEIKFMVIETDSTTISTKFHYTRSITKSKNCDEGFMTKFQTSISNFKHERACKPDKTLYPLKIKNHMEASIAEEEWLIQQGIGDIRNHGVHWQYIEKVKPKHGIAAPLKVSQDTLKKPKQLFCFLPLPANSGLPIHVNGSFILNSTRRDLWSSTIPGEVDDNTRWNLNLFTAIASSYADFLENSKSYFLKETYQAWPTALDDLHRYCKVYPCNEMFTPTEANKRICSLYKILVDSNVSILCVFLSKTKTGLQHITKEWHPLNSTNKAEQVYFWGKTQNHEILQPILEMLGIKITLMNNEIRDVLNKFISASQDKIPFISSESVFSYYTTLSCFSTNNGMMATHISGTVFKNMDTFILFIKFLLNYTEKTIESQVEVGSTVIQVTRQESSYEGVFPDSPVSHFLLVSADGILKQFNETEKILNSNYSSLFSKDLDKFIHLSLCELQLSKAYFILQLEEEENKEYAIDLIVRVFKNALPTKLSEMCVITEASSHVDKQQLSCYWDVFRNDPILNSYMPHVLEQVAMLLTTDDKLYSLSSNITPMYLPRETESDEANIAIEIFKKLNMSFLDEEIVCVKVDCPHLIENADKVLQNIVEINKIEPLTSILEKHEINQLMDYFAKHVNIRESSANVKSLPLFEDVTGQYQSIQHKSAYVWPNSCTNGYNSWIAGHEVVFLISDGHWKCLGSAHQFSIIVISELSLYNQFIFPHPHFGQMSEDDRYTHLKYIRDILFSIIQTYRMMTSEDKIQKKCECQEFYSSLLSLNCIGPANAILLPVSAFCDHTQKVFHIFPDDFKTLPEVLRGPEWIIFCKQLNLQMSLSAKEYITYCHRIANGKVNNISEASEVFLEYLLHVGESFDDTALEEISTISFVHAVHPAKVHWLLEGHTPAQQLVPMKGSALLMLQHQLWTVRPLIQLPKYPDNLMEKLGVVSSPSVSDVISNITNISKTCYSNDSLFSKYPQNLKPPAEEKQVSNLIEILRKNFQHFQLNSDVSILQSLPCVPVYTENQNFDSSQVALVKPNSVIKSLELSVPYHPYIYALPKQLYDLFILENIGVSSDISIKHMQIVLEKIFLKSGGKPIDFNVEKVVQLAMNTLKEELQLNKYSTNQDKAAEDLSPLYLPDVDNVLQLSTTMLYADTSSYYSRLSLKLRGTSRFHFDPKSKYDVYAKDICRVLPELVRPFGLSQQCIQVPGKKCEETQNSRLAVLFLNSFQDKNCPENLKNAITRFVSEQKKESLIVQKISQIFKDIKVTTMKKLYAAIRLSDTDTEIGHLEVDHIFDKTHHHLYLNEKVTYERKVCSEIVSYILELITPLLNEPLKQSDKKSLKSFWKQYILSPNTDKVAMLCKLQITGAVGVDTDKYDIAQLGVEIPLYWQDKLDQDADNMYNPMEFVGYEVEENKIIVALIVYLVHSEQSQSIFYKKYKIFINDNDEKGIEVSILKLYKFLVENRKPPVMSARVRDDREALVPRDKSNKSSKSRTSFHKQGDPNEWKRIKNRKLICDQLLEIWQLPEDLKRLAIRRLYFRFHPDKNPDNAEEEYQNLIIFLKNQICHLIKNEPLDNPELKIDSTRGSTPKMPTTWSEDFDQWNTTARSQRKSRSRCQRNDGEQIDFLFGRGHKDVDKHDSSEGQRWIRQAENELTVLRLCLEHVNDTKGYAHVCFLSHEVAEKALKGAMYALFGVDARIIDNHQLNDNAHALRTIRPHEASNLPDHCIPLENHYLDTRFPNRWPEHADAPCDQYHLQDAKDAKQHAEEILRIVISIMPQD